MMYALAQSSKMNTPKARPRFIFCERGIVRGEGDGISSPELGGLKTGAGARVRSRLYLILKYLSSDKDYRAWKIGTATEGTLSQRSAAQVPKQCERARNDGRGASGN
jgi:hypothetical protein